MLTEEVIEKVTERLLNRIEETNTEILKEIGKVIKEVGNIPPSKAYQLGQIIKYGGSYEKIVNKLVKMTGLNVQEIITIFEEVAKRDYRFAKQFYDYRNINYIPYGQNIALQTQVRAIALATASNFANISNTTMLGYGIVDDKGNIVYKGLNQAYNELIDKAILSISQGKESFDTAMYKQIKAMGGGGLKVIYPTTYIDKNGNVKHYTRRLDSVVRSNIDTGLKRLNLEMQESIGRQFGSDGVEVTAHINSAPDHEDMQGRQYSNEEFEKLNNGELARDYNGHIRELEKSKNGSYRRISELNCRHRIFKIVLGVSKPEYTEEELQKFKELNAEGFELDGRHYTNYEGTQLQRQLESRIRAEKDTQIMAKASGRDDLILEAQSNITKLTNKYNEILKVSTLKSRKDRMRVPGYRRTRVK